MRFGRTLRGMINPRIVMLDLAYLALGLAAFALFAGYAALLRRL